MLRDLPPRPGGRCSSQRHFLRGHWIATVRQCRAWNFRDIPGKPCLPSTQANYLPWRRETAKSTRGKEERKNSYCLQIEGFQRAESVYLRRLYTHATRREATKVTMEL